MNEYVIGGGAALFLATLTVVLRAQPWKKNSRPSTTIAVLEERVDRHEEEIGELRQGNKRIFEKLDKMHGEVSFIKGKLS